jgi:hypothetical protein
MGEKLYLLLPRPKVLPYEPVFNILPDNVHGVRKGNFFLRLPGPRSSFIKKILNVEGIEPSTPGLKVHRSTTELYIL